MLYINTYDYESDYNWLDSRLANTANKNIACLWLTSLKWCYINLYLESKSSLGQRINNLCYGAHRKLCWLFIASNKTGIWFKSFWETGKNIKAFKLSYLRFKTFCQIKSYYIDTLFQLPNSIKYFILQRHWQQHINNVDIRVFWLLIDLYKKGQRMVGWMNWSIDGWDGDQMTRWIDEMWVDE